ncbi:recombination regulator RecX [Clostridium saccharobutylicum]|uniref:Regulatory protein RecX n=1 Tax=Clostridium saccharobutylicum DSM 13864 TaxID=1345695 RepID=U5MVT5_CLOSA|nr:recombination regulator RecX [Clostridium saccharobutylicum]AGX43756.1 regulatory protein RecX [Clostridium saccharobutylicum DSM 13864]AQR91054.1 regulatory protein RecX [Clostridium saccharobutylicum]AQS00958.1 regulatory protein RecX [Clostridium saccharobutylicum]AQS10696.1 regulatory protein RecX [Clostridium saccharobutylicum]AQS14941.1 regulatory protein RecX [Clostridium saccharobutylicum]
MAKITKIEIQKRNKERINLFLDGEYAFSLSLELMYKEGLKVNQEVDINILKTLAKKESYIRCKESALKIIERNYKTEKEVRDKLKLKGYEEDDIDSSIEFLKNYNFLNDCNYTKAFIKDKINIQGSQKIKYNLIKKGISKEIVQEQLSSINKDDEKITALNLAKKKLNIIKKSENDEYKISGKLYRFLISKGYGYDIVKEVVKEVMALDDFE